MNETLKKLQAKYDDPGISDAAEPEHYTELPVIEFSGELDAWRDSETVVALHEFLKAHKDLGFRIVELDGCPTMHFEPGLVPAEKERWQRARQALQLLIDAKPDLDVLRSRGLITLKMHLGWDRRGSS